MPYDRDQSCAIAVADTESTAHRAGLALRPMVERDIDAAVCLISRAMNASEGNQAQETLRFHFSCRRHGIDDGRRYYILTQGSAINGIAGLHHYVWGPPENVWLAWFAVEPGLQGQGVGTLLLDAVARKASHRGYMKLFVETYSTPEFARARDFYRAKGFIEAGHIQAYLGSAGDMVVFSKDLTNHV